MSAVDAAEALADGVRRGGGEAEELPVGDGGEGTAEAIHAVLGGEWRAALVSDPLGRPVQARWLLLPDGRAVVDAASALGLPLLAEEERDPLRASSRGLGELLEAALSERPSALVIGLGGTATVDGGAGLREVIARLEVPTTVLCDVRTRLADAARLFGPQKGASAEDVLELERRLGAMEVLRPHAEHPGSGAAGGLGAALAALGAELVPGADSVLDILGFDARAVEADVVVTGEGQVDETTFEGKAPSVVLARCRRLGVRCVLFGGRVVGAPSDVEVVALSGDPARSRDDLVALGCRLGSRALSWGPERGEAG